MIPAIDVERAAREFRNQRGTFHPKAASPNRRALFVCGVGTCETPLRESGHEHKERGQTAALGDTTSR